jgi:hypothetical protein
MDTKANPNIIALATFQGETVAVLEMYAPAYRQYKASYLIAFDCRTQWVNEADLTNIIWLAA